MSVRLEARGLMCARGATTLFRDVSFAIGAGEWLAVRDRPCVLDAKIDPDLCADWLEEAFRGH